MRVFIYIDVKNKYKSYELQGVGMCVTSNVLVMFSSFEIFDVISYKVVLLFILLILYAFCRSMKLLCRK